MAAAAAAAPPVREYQVTMYADNRSAYGFGMRVVGTEAGAARVLWIQPQGPAEQAGIRVGDRVSPCGFHFECTVVLYLNE